MANVQPQFEAFHDGIKLRRFKENQILRDKRDIIRGQLNERLPTVFEAHGESCPIFSFRDQGSYEIGTGIKPLDEDYDIDQGIYFLVATLEYPDPVVPKERVFEALYGHTHDVRIRRPCVTVFYSLDDEPIYHVDLAVYSDGSVNADGKDHLAKGRQNSDKKYRAWEVSDPQGLADAIFARFEGNDRKQFRRVVRYLKRWKDENFSSQGNAAPLGIGLTVASYEHLQPSYTDRLAGLPDDRAALRALVDAVINRFTFVWDNDEQKVVRRLAIYLPVEPWNDLFEQMTSEQMKALEDKLMALRNALDTAVEEVDPVEACKVLRSVLGESFPVPKAEETAKRHAPAIVSSSSSA